MAIGGKQRLWAGAFSIIQETIQFLFRWLRHDDKECDGRPINKEAMAVESLFCNHYFLFLIFSLYLFLDAIEFQSLRNNCSSQDIN